VRWVLDTNVITGLMRGDELLIARLEQLGRRAMSVPEPVWAELEYGITRLSASKKQARLRGRFELLREELVTAPWTPAVSAAFGRIKAELDRRGARLEDFDVAIAAHALAVDETLVSANVKHLSRVEGLSLEDWSR
jgi:tRNA(fMet)-specific endonuclease VapC